MLSSKFADEIAEAGLSGLAIVWDTSGRIHCGDGVTPEQVQLVHAIAARHKPGPTRHEINAERDRRINLGVLHNGKVFQSDAVSKQRLLGVVVQATLAIINGASANDLRWSDPNNDFTYISTDNTAVPFDAPGIIALGQAVAAHERNMIYKARALKDQPGGPPDDFADDSHWT